MGVPKYMDLTSILNDYLAEQGLTRLETRGRKYYVGDRAVFPIPLPGGLTHLAARA